MDADGAVVDKDGNQLLRLFYPWSNGMAQQLNVFPIPSRYQASDQPDPAAFTGTTPPTIGPFPLASVPRVSLPGIEPGVQHASR